MDKPLLFPKRDNRLTTPKFQLTKTVDVTILRAAVAGEYNEDGYYIEGLAEEIIVKANVQPLRGHELLSVPEADRTRNWIRLYTEDNIYVVDEKTGFVSDTVIWNGQKYKVVRTETYVMGTLDHTKAIAYRLPLTPDDLATVEEDNGTEEIIF